MIIIKLLDNIVVVLNSKIISSDFEINKEINMHMKY